MLKAATGSDRAPVGKAPQGGNISNFYDVAKQNTPLSGLKWLRHDATERVAAQQRHEGVAYDHVLLC